MPHFVKRKRGGGREKGRKERSKPGRKEESCTHSWSRSD